VVPQLRRLGELGIQTHTQLVLCPGVNDGEHLDRSIEELAALYPQVQTVGIVPVGLTRFRRNNHYQIKLDLRPYSGDEAIPIVEQVEEWQRRLRLETGTNFAYLSDEWYIMAGREFPLARQYDGFPQLENGVGMVRQLVEESKRSARKLAPRLERPVRATLVCGEMAAAFIARAFEPIHGVENLDLRQLVVKNDTLGGNVSCSGLLFGEEVVKAIRTQEEESGTRADIVFLPRRMFDFTGVRTLDEWTFERFQSELGRPVIAAEWTREVWESVQRMARGEDCYTRQPGLEREAQLG
jgi:NifB/MoaA-like Fe-S oxidoreductase